MPDVIYHRVVICREETGIALENRRLDGIDIRYLGGGTLLIQTRYLTVLLLAACICQARAQPLFTASETRPADAVVLFDGKDLSGWAKCGSDEAPGWKVENGYMQVQGGNICTKQKFTDCQLHVEFWLPLMANAQGQARANSGVYLQGRYEIQVLDSYGLKSQGGDCGAIYGVAVPLVNACRPPEQWQTYDIIFYTTKFDGKGNKTSDARITVLQNGVLIHNNIEVPGPTAAWANSDIKETGPIMLQDHGCAVRYRNVWIRPL